MKIRSNTENVLIVKNGINGDKGVNGYIHIKFSDDGGKTFTANSGEIPGKYLGVYTDNIEADSTDVAKYKWTLTKGESAYSIILTNENISFSVDSLTSKKPLNKQTYTCDVLVYHGTEFVENFTVNSVNSPSGISSSVNGKTIAISVDSTTAITSVSGSIVVKIAIGDNVVDKIISYSLVPKGADGNDGSSSIIASLSNESHVIPCDKNGNNGNYTGATSTISIYEGTKNVSSAWTVTATPSSGITGTLSGKTYTITNITVDSGYVDFTATRTNYATLTKRFHVSRTKVGATGQSATAYWMIVSSSVIKKNVSGTYSPTSITLTGKSQTGTNAVADYSGRFKIFLNNSTTTTYTSSANESSKIFTIPANTTSVRCVMYQANGTSVVLDEQNIQVVSDGKNGKDGQDGNGALNVSVGNESQNIPCDKNGNVAFAFDINIPFAGYKGLARSACTVSVGTLPSGITQKSNTASTTSSDGLLVLSVAKGSNIGTTTRNGSIELTFSVDENTVTKKLSWTKTLDGQDGVDARLYTLNSSTSVIKKQTIEDEYIGDESRNIVTDELGNNIVSEYKEAQTLSPSQITFTSNYRDGNSTTLHNYAGRFIVSESLDGNTFATKYTSEIDESTLIYSPSAYEVQSIKCDLYASGGTTIKLDSQTIIVLTDAEGLNKQFTVFKDTFSDVKLQVDNNAKEISMKATQTDIEKAISNYDTSSIENIRNQVAEHKVSIGNITSKVSEVETSINKKADGSTVSTLTDRVSKVEQDTSGFKQTVSETYATKDSLSDYAKTTEMSSAIEQSAKDIKLSVSQTYSAKSDAIKSVDTEYYLSDKTDSLIGGHWTTDCPPWTEGKYIWTKTKTTYADGSYDNGTPVCISGKNGTDGVDGDKGDDGVGVSSITEQYYQSNSPTELLGGSWSSDRPTWVNGKYIWTRSIIQYTNNTSYTTKEICVTGGKGEQGERGLRGLQGDNGKDGIDGVDGENGKTSYFHIKYSPVENPTSSSQITETPSDYIGTYVDFVESDSTNPAKYIWTRFKGLKGDQGIPGVGKDGKTSYLHVAYANSSDGSTGFSVSESSGKLFIGQYTDFVEDDSTDYKKYKWSLIKGEDGTGISSVSVQYYISTSPTSLVGGSWSTNTPTGTTGKYVWSKTVTSLTNGKNTESNPSRITGDKGSDGNGITSTSVTYQVGDSGVTKPTTTNWTTSIPNVPSGKFLWTKTTTNYSVGNPTNSYSVSYCAENGQDGKGISSTSVTYIASDNGSSAPSDAENWSSTIPTDIKEGQYLWTRTIYTFTDSIKQKLYSVGYKGVNGINGISISSVINYYLVSDKSTGITISGYSWDTTVPTMTKEKPYLWNYEVSKGSNGNTISTTSPIVIGHFGINGVDGNDGKEITSIIEYYAVNNNNSSAPSDSLFVEGKVQTTTSSNRFLWNYEVINYSDGSKTPTLKRVIGTYGDKGDKGDTGATGKGVVSIVPQYYISTSSTSLVNGEWKYEQPAWSKDTYIWTRSEITYKNPSSVEHTTPVYDKMWSSLADVNKAQTSLKIEVDNVTTEVTNARGDRTSLAVRIDGIDQEISDVRGNSSTLKQRVDSISSTVSNIKIGGRNLIRNSDTLIFDSYYFVASITDELGNLITDESSNEIMSIFI